MNLNDQSGVSHISKIINVESDEEIEKPIDQKRKSDETTIDALIEQNVEEKVEETMVEEQMDKAFETKNVKENQ